MIDTITEKIKHWLGLIFIFAGLFVILLGAAILKTGAWLSERHIYPVGPDLTAEELDLAVKPAMKSRRSKND